MSLGKNDQLKRKRVYFQPGEVLLLVEHENDDQFTPEVIAAEVREIMSSIYQGLDGSMVDSGRIVTFPHGPSVSDLPEGLQPLRGAFSLLTLDVAKNVDSPAKLIELIEAINNRLSDPDQPQPGGRVTPRAAAPNWLTVPTQGLRPLGNNADGGGPGARPEPFDHGGIENPPYKFSLPHLASLLEQADGGAVDVGILDTAPSRAELRAAYARYPKQYVLRHLLQPTGRPGPQVCLEITYADCADIILPLPEELRVKDHDYQMTDHGLFAAGIIGTIAPTAHLHLVQVLNDVGVGTAESIAQGLNILQRWSLSRGRPLVVNCSLMLVEPMPTHDRPKDDEDGDDEIELWPEFVKHLEARGVANPVARKQLEEQTRMARRRLAMAIEWICLSVYDSGITIVAAAGNDAINGKDATGKQRPEARFPAAFDKVVGVGALKRDGDQAEYSNISDRPGYVGIATLGGRAIMKSIPGRGPKKIAYAVPGESVLGVYIGKFPDVDPHVVIDNDTGWGWWAGTSFAAPIVSGAIAALVSRGYSAHDAVGSLYGATSGKTVDNEPKLIADQFS